MKTPHKHCDIIKAWAEGDQIQYFSYANSGWVDLADYPIWDTRGEYRIKPEPDLYQHLKEAHARGEQIEVLSGDSWVPINHIFQWNDPVSSYRIAPKKELPPKQPYSQDSWTGLWVRITPNGNFRHVTEVATDGIYSGVDKFGNNSFRSWDQLCSGGWEWSISLLGPWNPCYL